MEILNFFYWLMFYFIFGICNIAYLMMFRHTKISKFYIIFLVIIWNFFMSFYVFEIFPGSKNYFAAKRIEGLTGQNVKVKTTYIYDEFGGFQGDGYTLYFYDFEKLKSLDSLTLKKHPIQNNSWRVKKWKQSPINSDDLILLENHLETNTYNNKDSLKLHLIYSYFRKASATKGNFYTISEIKNRGIELGLFSNENHKFLYLNSTW